MSAIKKKSKALIYDIAKVMNWLPKMRNLKLVMSFFSSDTSRMDRPFAAKKCLMLNILVISGEDFKEIN